MEAVVRTARTVEEAEELALKELGADRNEVEVEILNKGKAGFLGIGAELAQVRVTLLSAQGSDDNEAGLAVEAVNAAAGLAVEVVNSEAGLAAEAVNDDAGLAVEVVNSEAGLAAEAVNDDAGLVVDVVNSEAGLAVEAVNNAAGLPVEAVNNAAGLAVQVVNNILGPAKVNVVSTLRSAYDPDVGGPIIDLTGEDSGLLIGRRGQTLTALQFLANLIVRQELGEDVRVMLDVEHYRQRREASLRDMAAKVASRVDQTGRSITLEPMSAADRRIVHISLADHPGVSTESMGFGDDRKVTVIPSRE